MNLQSPFLIALMISVFVNACVTTRAELNEKQANTTDTDAPAQSTEAVKSEASPVSADEEEDDDEDELKVQVATLTGKVEELEHEKQLKETEHAEEVKKLQAQIEELQKKLKSSDGPALPEGKNAFEAGKDAYFAEHYSEAVEFFNQYLKDDSVKSADEATYLRGEAQFKLKNYKKAIIDYSTFPEKFQKSSYHPKALLRIAESFEVMGQKDDAKAFYSDLVDQFPKTAEGKLAKKRLKKK